MVLKSAKKISFDKKSLIISILLLALIISLVGYNYYLKIKDNIVSQNYKELAGIANLKISEISRWYKDEQNDLGIIFEGGYLPRFTNDWVEAGSDENLKRLSDYILSLKRQHDYEDVLVLTADGTRMLSSSHGKLSGDPSLMVKAEQAILTGKVVPTDIHRGSGGIFIDFTVPVKGRNGSYSAVVIFRINPNSYLYPILSFQPVASKSTESLLLRREGDKVLFLNDLRFAAGKALMIAIDLKDESRPAVKAVMGYRGIFMGKDYRGVEVVAHLGRIDGTPWFIVTQVEKEEIFSKLYTETGYIIVVVFLLILLFAFILFSLYSRSQKNLYGELFSSREKYRDMFENNPAPMWIYDLRTLDFLEVNEAAIIKYGYSREEFLRMKISDIRPKEDMTQFYDEMKKTGIDYNPGSIWRHLKKGGEVMIVEVRSHTFLFNGTPARNVLINDITEMMDAVEKLRLSEQRFREMFENHSAVMLFLDPSSGKILDVNNAAGRYYGYSRQTLKNMYLSDLNISTKSEIMETITAVREKRLNHYEAQHRLSDGSLRDIEVFSSPIKISEEEFLYSIIHDITERKRGELRIKLLSKSIEQSPVSVLITDPNGIIEYVNTKFTEVTGYSAEEVMGKTPAILNSGKQTAEFYEDLWDTILSGKDWKGEIQNKRKNGTLFWESVIISAIVNEGGDVSHFVSVKEDITRDKLILEELIAAKNKAEEMNRIKSSFFANMSHELRTPLIGILGYAEILQDDMLEKDDVKKMADTIEKGGLRLLKTLNLILNLSKIEANKHELKIERTEIVARVREVYELFISVAKGKRIGYSFNPTALSVYCDIDVQMLDHILTNLINNAIKYTTHGGVLVDIYEDPDSVYIEVKDTGIGIPKEMQDIIWDEFRQVSEGMDRTYEGTGLGLTIAKKYAEYIGARISVESTLGQGSNFMLQIPRSRGYIAK